MRWAPAARRIAHEEHRPGQSRSPSESLLLLRIVSSTDKLQGVLVRSVFSALGPNCVWQDLYTPRGAPRKVSQRDRMVGNSSVICSRIIHPGPPCGCFTKSYAPAWRPNCSPLNWMTLPTSAPTGSVHALRFSTVQS